MRFLPAALLPLVFVVVEGAATEKPCYNDNHIDILDTLSQIFESGGGSCDNDAPSQNGDLKLQLCKAIISYENGSYELVNEYYYTPEFEPASTTLFGPDLFLPKGSPSTLDFANPPSQYVEDGYCFFLFENFLYGDKLSLWMDADNRPCPDNHQDVYNQIKDAFGEENCFEAEILAYGTEPNTRLQCELYKKNFYDYFVWYYYIPSDLGPERPTIIDTFDFTPFGGGVNYMDFLAPYDDVERPNEDDTCFDKAFDGAYLTTLDSVKNRACANNYQPFQNEDDEEETCSEIGNLRIGKRKKACKDPLIAENCPGMCNKEDCGCIDNPFWSSGKNSCDALNGYSEKRRKKKCGKKKFMDNCPSICDEQCVISA